MFDTHCHLTFPDYEGRLGRVLEEAGEAGVRGCVTISTSSHDCLAALALAERFPNVWCSAGVHPLYSHQGPHDWERLLGVARHEKCVAWGELGLDEHYDTPARDTQHAVLAEQLAFIGAHHAEVDLPVVIHCREAFATLIPILRGSGLAPERFVFHCFTGGPDDARAVLDFGAMISFTGVLTYKNAPEVREAAALVPLDRVMVETDAPFLSPEPHRGVRPNEPRLVPHVARTLAEIHGVAYEELEPRLDDNARRFFGIDF